MSVDYCIIPECYTDTALIEALVPPLNKNGYNHQMGCNKVSGCMQQKFNNSFAVGIIDKDKRQIRYLDEFEEISKKNHLSLHKHKSKHHYIIQIAPAIEVFIMNVAKEANINFLNLGLTPKLEEFKQITKISTSKKDRRLLSLFTELSKKNIEELTILSTWIKYLKENTYKSDIEFLRNS